VQYVTQVGEFTVVALEVPDGTAARDATAAVGTATLTCAVLAGALGMTPASVVGALLGVAIVAGAGTSVLARPGRWSGPADRVSLARSVLIAACATLALPVALGQDPARSWNLLVLVAPTLLLDAVDGAVARASGTASAAGGRLDGELDAAALMVLSLAAGRTVGWWVLAIGLMRYAFLIAGNLRSRLREPLAFSQFRRVVAAVQGIALAVALGPVVPTAVGRGAVAIALALLTISFGRDVVDLERRGRPRLHSAG